MNIRRIIREEMDGLEWMRNTIPSSPIKNERWILVNDVDPKSEEEGNKIQQYLFDLEYGWGIHNHRRIYPLCIGAVYHVPDTAIHHLAYHDGCKNSNIKKLNRDIESGEHVIYYWSDLKPKTIKEETDFDWVNEPRNNPLDGLRLTTPMGRLGDGLTIKDDGGTYVTVISSNGSSEYHRGTVKNFIKMGIWLPKKDINESDEFDWVKDTLTTKLSEDEDWILVNDVDPKSLEVSHQIQQYLFDLGYSWNTDNSKPLKNFYIHSIYHYGQLRGYDEGQMYYADGYSNHQIRTSRRDIASGEYMVYYWSDLKPKTIKESDELDWIRKATPSKWDYFEEMIKDEPDINIEKNEDGEWVDLKDSRGRRYFDEGLLEDYGLEEDIKSNSLPNFLNTISQHIEVTFQGYDFESDEDYWDFRTLEEVLEKANKKV